MICDIKIDGTGTLKIRDTDVKAELNVHATNQSTITGSRKAGDRAKQRR